MATHQLAAVDVLLDGEQHLIWVNRFDDIVGDFGAYGLVHDVLLLALGNHHNRQVGSRSLDLRQRFESRHAGHHLVENHQVEHLG